MPTGSITLDASRSGDTRTEEKRKENLDKINSQLALRKYKLELKYEKLLQKAREKNIDDLADFD